MPEPMIMQSTSSTTLMDLIAVVFGEWRTFETTGEKEWMVVVEAESVASRTLSFAMVGSLGIMVPSTVAEITTHVQTLRTSIRPEPPRLRKF